MKREEKERLQNEIIYITKSISKKKDEIINTPEYKKTEEDIYGLMERIKENNIKYKELRLEVYNKYGASNYSFYSGIRLSEIKSSVRQGIKVGLGMTSIKSIENNIVRIVKKMIAEDLKEPNIEKLNQKKLEVEEKINKLRIEQNKFIKDGTDLLVKARNKIHDEVYSRKPIINLKLRKQQKEADEKVKNLSEHLSKIMKEVNRRLILDGVTN